MIKEDLIQFVWQYGLFTQNNLKTIQNDEVIVFKPGELNTNQGPDFLNSKIQIGNVTWAGNLEIHIKTSDFYKHKHHLDPAFKNIILHVVYENDIADGDLPVLELKDKISKNIFSRFVEIQQNKRSIPCSDYIGNVDGFVLTSWLQRLSVERLENKCNIINEKLIHFKLDWEIVFWQMIFKYMGGTVNKQIFELLANNTDFKLLIKNASRINFVEAYLFGIAGMLNENLDDNYFVQLKSEFHYIKHNYNVKEISPELWKYMRMRPAAFPTIRIAQLAELLKNHPRLFTSIIDLTSIKQVCRLFEQRASEYWNTHFRFGIQTNLNDVKKLGQTQIDLIIINVVVPMLFSYGRLNNKIEYEEKAVKWLETLPSENNKIVREFIKLTVKPVSAQDSQALIELKNNYCKLKKCLNCGIGSKIFRNFVN